MEATMSWTEITRRQLEGRVTDCPRDGFLTAMEVSADRSSAWRGVPKSW